MAFRHIRDRKREKLFLWPVFFQVDGSICLEAGINRSVGGGGQSDRIEQGEKEEKKRPTQSDVNHM